MVLSMLAALFGISVATSSKRQAEEIAVDDARGTGRKASMADKYMSESTQTGMYVHDTYVSCSNLN